MKRVFLLALFLLASSYCYGGTRRPDVSDEKYVEYGSKFVCIGKICGTYKSGQNYCASAVAIKSRWIVTAAHVVQNSEVCFVTFKDKKIKLKSIICHDDFNEHKYGFADIAVGLSEEDLNLDFYPSLYNGQSEVGKVCSMAGYGLTGTFNSGVIFSDNKKRAGSNIIESIENDLLVCSPSKINERITQLEFLIGSGDSGGGLFIDGKLAGVNSCVFAIDKNPNSTYSDQSGHTRVSKYIDWIDQIIKSYKE